MTASVVTASASDLIAALAAEGDPDRAIGQSRYFKTGAGEYGAGDVFLGVTVPIVRATVKPYRALPLDQVTILLDSKVHEHRLSGLLILNAQVAKNGAQVSAFYLDAVRRGRVNNWDLVDASAEFILGQYLRDRDDRDVLFELARGASVWERRVAMIATFGFIKVGDASTGLAIAEILLEDGHDLIQKAVGWMLREIGKRVDRGLLLAFLDQNAARMPRTALSYAIEHLAPEQRAYYRSLQ
jgi:3-methyladenine DNA glycosylase AlkD